MIDQDELKPRFDSFEEMATYAKQHWGWDDATIQRMKADMDAWDDETQTQRPPASYLN